MSENTLRSPKTLKAHAQALALAAFMVLTPLLLLEGMLRVIDPWRIAYFDDTTQMLNDFEPDSLRDYHYPDGLYQYSNWQATIVNNSRLVPLTNRSSDCQIVIIGDSVAFGYGVNDADTWVSQLALQFPAVQFINAGVPTYGSQQIRGNLAAFPDADAYLYLIVYNDWENFSWQSNQIAINPGAALPYLIRYGKFIQQGSESRPNISGEDAVNDPRFTRFIADIDAMLQDPRLSLIAFENDSTTDLLLTLEKPLSVIPFPSQRISVVDWHPNLEGNRALAASIAPIAENAIETHCD